MTISRRSTHEMLAFGMKDRLQAARRALDEAMTEAAGIANMLSREGFSEAELARRLGVSRDTVRDWLGKRRVRRDVSLSRQEDAS